MKKFMTVLIVSGLMITGSAIPAQVAHSKLKEGHNEESAKEYLKLTNKARKKNKTHELIRYNKLDTVAQNWAKTMARNNKMSHNPNIRNQIPKNWRSLGENIAYGCGFGAAVIHDLWIKSPAHYRNIVNPKFNSIGIGAYVDNKGCLWSVQVFGKYDEYQASATATRTKTKTKTATYTKTATKTIRAIDSKGKVYTKRISKTFKTSKTAKAKSKATVTIKSSSFISKRDAYSKALEKAKTAATKKAIRKASISAKKKASISAKKATNAKIREWKNSYTQ